MNVEKAKAIKASIDWEEICKELDFWIQGALQQTKTCTPEQLQKIQSKISTYEEVQRLPQIVIEREE